MKANPKIKFQKHRSSGIVRVQIKTQRGVQWLSTGQTSFERAREVCDAAMLERLQMAACADVLTADAISRFTTGKRFTCVDILTAWKDEARLDLAPDTLAAYESILRQWLAFCECEKKPLSAVFRRDLHAFVNEAKVVAGTRKARLASLRSYYKFASAGGYCVGNPAELIKVQTRDLLFSQLEAKETLPITEEEYRRLMESPRVSTFWRAATALGYWLGYRLRDIACYEVASLKESTTTIFMRKTGQRLELPLNDPLLGGGELHRILREIVEQAPLGQPFCFPEKREVALDTKRRSGLSVAYQRVLNRHGIRGKRFHGLRHACAMRLKTAGLTLEEIAERLGHKNTEVTKTYTNHLSPPYDATAQLHH